MSLWLHQKEPSNATGLVMLRRSNKNRECEAGVEADKTLCLEPEPPEHFMRCGSHIRSWDIFSEPEPETLNILRFASHPFQGCGVEAGVATLCLGTKSESPRLFTQSKNPTFGWIFPRTPKPEQPPILDLMTAGRYITYLASEWNSEFSMGLFMVNYLPYHPGRLAKRPRGFLQHGLG